MHLDENVIRWTAGLCLDIGVAALAVRSGLFKRLPVFTCYLFVVAACDVASTLCRVIFPVRSFPVFYEYWGGQAVMMGMRAASVAEICYRLLGPYRGIWRLCRIFLVAVALFLVVSAGFAAGGQQHSMTMFITLLQRGMELAIAGTLAFSFLFAKYYQVKLERFMALIIGGLMFYSAVQIGNSQFMNQLKGPYFDFYAELSLAAFSISTLIWLAAVWRPVPELTPVLEPVEADAEALGASRQEVNARLRELNARLSEILR